MLNADIVIVGAGPNGLAAAITLARAGYKPEIFEMSATPGGGLRTGEITLPGYYHDLFSAIHPLALASPFFQSLDLEAFGVTWVHAPFAMAHPFNDGSAAILSRSIHETCASIDMKDRKRYCGLMRPLLDNWKGLVADVLAPIHIPKSIRVFAEFGLRSAMPAAYLVNRLFEGQRAKGLLAGLCAHSFLPFSQLPSAAFGLILGSLGHAVGWPMPESGALKFGQALARCAENFGSSFKLNYEVKSLRDFSGAGAVLLDITPKQWLDLSLNQKTLYSRLYRRFRYGPGIFKIDWALSDPIPWKAPECRQAGKIHIGGSFEDLARSEEQVSAGLCPERPFVLLTQPTLFDSSRAPENKHIAWAYCHVPLGSQYDMRERIEAQIERFAPGFRDCILARAKFDTSALQDLNPNFIGGDINGGSLNLFQLFLRPFPKRDFYATSQRGVFLCSSSTPPGPGVHGMCGFHAALSALRYLERKGGCAEV